MYIYSYFGYSILVFISTLTLKERGKDIHFDDNVIDKKVL